MDKAEVYRTLETFCPNGSLIEVRALHNTKKTDVWSGYFKDYDLLWESIQRFDSEYNIYFIFNVIDDSCYSMAQKDRMLYGAENTKDSDIVARSWVLIDLDANRNHKKISSTDEEWQDARLKAHEIRNYLKDMGFSYPVVCSSGNGLHLLYKINEWAITPENDKLVSDFLNALSLLFSDEKVEVDVKVGNAARITKLYGTIARKGANDTKRPHRLSKILVIPSDIKDTDKEYFKKVASILPVEEKTNYSSIKNNDNFNIDAFISEHHIGVSKDCIVNGVRKIVLDECPFDSSHKAPDSAIFILPSGAMGFTCFHSSCSHYTFKDFRLHFDPNAYDKKDYYEYQHKQMYYSPIPKKVYEIQKETSDKGNKWLSMKDIKYVDLSKMVAIPTGYESLDKKIMGLMLGDVTVLSGLSGSGKTSWIDCVALNIVQRGYKVAIWSGELQDFRFQGWIDQIAAGKTNVIRKEGYDNFYYAPKNICDKVNNWLDNKLFLYNNAYKNKWEQLFYDIKELVEKEGVQLVILDNLMALDINGYDGDKYSQQTKFINDLKEYAKLSNIHVILVAHPRKEMGFLRKESISGTADLTNLADNVIILHRIGKDFETRAGEFFGKDKIIDYLGYSTVIELCKNRSFGIVDLLVGMYYEQESRRLKNTIAEHIRYGWEDAPKPQPIFSPEPTTWHNQESKDVEEEDDGLPFNNDRDFPFGKEIDEVPF